MSQFVGSSVVRREAKMTLYPIFIIRYDIRKMGKILIGLIPNYTVARSIHCLKECQLA